MIWLSLALGGGCGFDVLKKAVSYNYPVALLAAHPLTPENLGDYFKEVHAYLPKERLSEIVPFLEEVLKYHYLPGWRRLFDKITGFRGKKIEIDWRNELALSRQGWISSDVRSKTP